MKNIVWWVLIGLGFLVRVVYAMKLSFWGDEYMYFSVGTLPVERIILVKHWLVDHPQLFILIQHVMAKMSRLEWWMRIPSLLSYLVGAIYVKKLVEYLLKGEWVGQLLVMGVFALHPFFVSIGAQAIPYSMAIALFVMNLYFFILAMEGNQRVDWLKWGISMLVYLYTSFESVFYLGSLLVVSFLWRHWKLIGREKMRSFWASLGVVTLGFLPEIFLVLSRSREMVNLNSDFMRNFNHIKYLLYVLLGVGKSYDWNETVGWEGLVIVAVTIIILGWRIGIGWLSGKIERSELKKVSLVVGLAGGFLLALEVVSAVWYPVGRDKTYYYVILLLVVLIVWLGLILKKKKLWLVWVIVTTMLVGIDWVLDGPREAYKWLSGSYLRTQSVYDPRGLRAKINEMVKGRGEEWVVYSPHLQDLRNVALTEYYLKCLDGRTNECEKYAVFSELEQALASTPKRLLIVGRGYYLTWVYCNNPEIECKYVY